LLQRLFALVLVAGLVPWSQAEVCPMRLRTQSPDACGASMPLADHHSHQAASDRHDCCPKTTVHAKQSQCPPTEVRACNSGMTCCSVDPQPAGSVSVPKLVRSVVVLSMVSSSIDLQPVHEDSLAAHLAVSNENFVFRLKEDLRI